MSSKVTQYLIQNLTDAGIESVIISKDVTHLLLLLTTNAYFKAYELRAFNGPGIMDNGDSKERPILPHNNDQLGKVV